MILRSLLLVVLLAVTGCPHPAPTPVTPVDPVADAGVDVVGCNITTATQDTLTGNIVNAMMDTEESGNAAMTLLVRQNGLETIRCVMSDFLTDVRGAPKAEARGHKWLAAHGGDL